MVIQEFGLVQFRNYQDLFVEFSNRINFFIGRNGQGKTNLAEGIYYLAHLSSFRTRRLGELLRSGAPRGYIQGAVTRDDFPLKARIELSRQGRRVWLDEEAIARTSRYISEFYVFLFNPERLYGYRQQPAERRALFNRYLAFIDAGYLNTVKGYRVVLAQKNRLLKNGEKSSLPDWNKLFVQKSYDIILERAESVSAINQHLAGIFHQLTGRQERLRLVYLPSLRGDAAEGARVLERVAERERLVGHALYGPHRDDFRLEFAGSGSEELFSQGEYRAAWLALQMAMSRLMTERMRFRPVWILDDLFSELDQGVCGRVLDVLAAGTNQVFITTTELPRHLRLPEGRIMEIESGRVA